MYLYCVTQKKLLNYSTVRYNTRAHDIHLRTYRAKSKKSLFARIVNEPISCAVESIITTRKQTKVVAISIRYSPKKKKGKKNRK